jgi:transcriptional regulator with XRE-family HTH domain
VAKTGVTTAQRDSFGQVLGDTRLILKLRQADLASRIGVREATVSQYENNKRVPKTQTLELVLIVHIENLAGQKSPVVQRRVTERLMLLKGLYRPRRLGLRSAYALKPADSSALRGHPMSQAKLAPTREIYRAGGPDFFHCILTNLLLNNHCCGSMLLKVPVYRRFTCRFRTRRRGTSYWTH